jgi:L-seryl-tRNA(Ser) seleniumtransferase
VVQKTHRSGFDRAVRVAGGRFVEVEPHAEAIEAALNNDVAGVLYTLAWFCDGPATELNDVCRLAHARGIPVIVDAAAEVPPVANLRRFVDEGADLVTFSGGKAIGGPQSSGLVLGRDDLIRACAFNDAPNMNIGRGTKVAKEEIVGLVRALELYLERDHAEQMTVWETCVAYMVGRLQNIDGVRAVRQLPYGVGQQIPHVALTWDPATIALDYSDVVDRLYHAAPRIAVQLHRRDTGEYNPSVGPQIRIHPHTLRPGEERIVAEKIADILSSAGPPSAAS